MLQLAKKYPGNRTKKCKKKKIKRNRRTPEAKVQARRSPKKKRTQIQNRWRIPSKVSNDGKRTEVGEDRKKGKTNVKEWKEERKDTLDQTKPAA